MDKTKARKSKAVGIILLFALAAFIPAVSARIERPMIHMFPQKSGFLSDDTLTDWTNDVSECHFRTNKWTIITNSTDIDVQNIDVIQAIAQQQEGLVTLGVQVAGSIENRGHWDDWVSGNETIELVEYDFHLITSQQEYLISYVNQTGAIQFNTSQINLTSSDFTVINDTLSITFPLVNPEETFENLSVMTLYINVDVSSKPYKIVLYADTVPNYWSKVFLFGRYTNAPFKGEYMTIEAVRLWMIRPGSYHQILRYRPGDLIRLSTPYKGRIITNHFLFGYFDILEA